MFKRRIVTLGAVAALLLAGGLAGSANASDEPPAKGTCVTSDGKTFEFTEAVPALKIEGGAVAVRVDESQPDAGKTGAARAGAAEIEVAKIEGTKTDVVKGDGSEHVQRWSKVTETVPATPAQPASPNAEGGGADAPTAVTVAPTTDGPAPEDLSKAITITCTAK
ncbi:hypothetical protein [Nonomuraea africana]|uniref:Secreted protein n=1 Tax=Nonomuraea africana TaxID=46171 RepID=A0ABR9KR55_9ACTN|nr:hypothetical protein [Nonomuraea africana]MBE1564511.1 hypothetical protein [Nonomuraea africana]